jgi:hypothetical protein
MSTSATKAKAKKPNPMESDKGYTLIIIPLNKKDHPHAHAARSMQMRSTLLRNGHNFRHLLGRASDGSERRMFAVNFDDATKERISKLDPKHTRGVIHVDAKGNAVHSSGKKLGKVTKVSEAEARKEKNSMRDAKSHYVIK